MTTLLDYAYHKETLLYLTTTSLVFKMSMHLAHVMMTTKPVTLDKARAQGFVFRMYEPLMERYLEKEGEYIKASYKAAIEGWINMVGIMLGELEKEKKEKGGREREE